MWSFGIVGRSKTIRSDRLRLRPGFNHWVTGAGRTWVLLVTAAILPLLLFGGLAASFSAEHTRAATRALASGTAEQVAARISAELAAQITLAQALAVSTALDNHDVRAFRIEAERLKALHPLWREIDLLTPSGSKLQGVNQCGELRG